MASIPFPLTGRKPVCCEQCAKRLSRKEYKTTIRPLELFPGDPPSHNVVQLDYVDACQLAKLISEIAPRCYEGYCTYSHSSKDHAKLVMLRGVLKRAIRAARKPVD